MVPFSIHRAMSQARQSAKKILPAHITASLCSRKMPFPERFCPRLPTLLTTDYFVASAPQHRLSPAFFSSLRDTRQLRLRIDAVRRFLFIDLFQHPSRHAIRRRFSDASRFLLIIYEFFYGIDMVVSVNSFDILSAGRCHGPPVKKNLPGKASGQTIPG